MSNSYRRIDSDLPSRVLFFSITALAAIGLASTAFAQCGEPGSGTCCAPHTNTGCEDRDCCMTVCKVDPFCCDVGWDEYCAGAASVLCAGCEATPVVVMAFGGSTVVPGGTSIDACDLASYNPETGVWATYFDGDDVGLSGKTISAASRLPDGDLLFAISGGGVLADLVDAPVGNAYDGQDLLRFTPTTLGSQTSGTWSFFFDGSDVGLGGSTSYEIISASVIENGLVIGLKGSGSLPGMGSFTAYDLMAFTPASYGSVTDGSWQKFFEGADVGLTTNNEKLDAACVDTDGTILLSTKGNFTVYELGGGRGDIFEFIPTTLGTATSGNFNMYLSASTMGLSGGANSSAIFISRVSYPTGQRPPDGGGGGGNEPTCGDPLALSCCIVHNTPYCADGTCCEAVCAVDPVCCDAGWDQYCVNAAAALCEPCLPTPLVVAAFGTTYGLPGGVAVEACDLAAFDTGTGLWSMYLHGSDVGLSGMTIAAATVLPDGDLLLSFEAPGTLPGLLGGPDEENFDEFDILRFTPISLGDSSSGAWSFYFDGSDVGLSSSANQSIRAIGSMADGSLLIATLNGGSLAGVGAFKQHDLVRFEPLSLGDVTSGTWSMHFDGSDVGLSHNSQEPIDSAFVKPDGRITFSTRGNISVSGYSGGKSDLVEFTPTQTGSTTTGSFSVFLTAGSFGLATSANIRAAFEQTPVVPDTPRPSDASLIMFDRLPHDATHQAAINDGFERYIIIYQGVDPDAKATGVINAEVVIQAILEQEGPSPSGYGVLDFEFPFMARLEAGPSDPNWQMTVDTVVNLLQQVKAAYPGVQWTMYGMPSLPYWSPNGGYGWNTMSEEEREALIAQRLEAFFPVLAECDWLNPSVYDRYELALYTPEQQPAISEREAAWRHYKMEVCNRFNQSSGQAAKPTIAMVSPMFWKVGNIEYNMKQTPIAELLSDQVHPMLLNGADGVALWTGFTYYPRAATSAADLGQGQIDTRYAFTQDYLDGVEPADWTDPALFELLVELTSQYALQRLGEIRADLEVFIPGNTGP